jgi:hypothetical protein
MKTSFKYLQIDLDYIQIHCFRVYSGLNFAQPDDRHRGAKAFGPSVALDWQHFYTFQWIFVIGYITLYELILADL